MMFKKALLATIVLFAVTPVLPALAHDDDYNGYSSHERLHDDLGDAHERAHEEGFGSRAEHRAYHRALRNMHEGYHDERDGYQRYYTPRSYYAPRYRSYYGYGWW